MQVEISSHFQSRSPSAIRQAQILFAERPDRSEVQVINLAIGNVSLPMHPAMRERMFNLDKAPQFANGVVKYTASVGTEETQQAFLNVIGSGGFDTSKLKCVVTDGGSMAMELMILGVCGPGSEQPLLLLDPAYSNYNDIARRNNCKTVSLQRMLKANGRFSAPGVEELEAIIDETNPRGLVVIPADNPTGQFLSHEELKSIASVCVKKNIWLISDEAYRQLQYQSDQASSVWAITEAEVPGITGRRLSIESSSKVWNACGLRIGALVTDNEEFHRRAVAEFTANLCANAIGQYVFGALAHLTHEELNEWYRSQRHYYQTMMRQVSADLEKCVPGIIVSNAEAALYSVIDLRNIVSDFDCKAFIQYCASEGHFELNGQKHTLLLAPMNGFYSKSQGGSAASQTQMRMAYVAPPEEMHKMPELFAGLFTQYCEKAGHKVLVTD